MCWAKMVSYFKEVMLTRWRVQRRQTLLVEMQRKHKVGGLIDRRYGEENSDQELDEVMVERFAKEKQRSHKHAMFNLVLGPRRRAT